MVKIFLDILIGSSPYSVYCLACILICWYLWKFRPLEKNVKNIKEDITVIKENILSNIEPSLNKLASYLMTRHPKDKELLNIQSPIELTDLAKEILEKSGAKDFIDSSLGYLIAKIIEGKPKSDLDIHPLAASILFNLVDTKEFTKIKDFIYQNPKYNGQHDIDIQITINLSALYLRDRYLTRNKSGDIKKVESI